MKVLVINAGSSSLKYQLMNPESAEVYAKGLVERIGLEEGIFNHTKQGQEKLVLNFPIPNHKVAINKMLELLCDKEHGVLESMAEIDAVGHRVVHGEKNLLNQ